jgi:uncharacterized membrane protein
MPSLIRRICNWVVRIIIFIVICTSWYWIPTIYIYISHYQYKMDDILIVLSIMPGTVISALLGSIFLVNTEKWFLMRRWKINA